MHELSRLYQQRHGNNNLFDVEQNGIVDNALPVHEIVDLEDEDFGGVWHIPINNEENILI